MFRVHGNRAGRRVLAVALAALVLGAALTATNGGWPLGRAGAAGTTCVWIKHTKRVVKHVKRHGKPKRVVHLKHYVTCRKVAVPEPTPTVTTPAPVTTAPSETAPTPAPEPEPNAVSITAYEKPGFSFGASRQTVKAGQLTVQLIDAGEDEHNMKMQRVGPGEVPEGPVVTMVSALPTKPSEPVSVTVQPGTYRMWCTLPHHDEKGMHTTITVE
jgi:plastocyanin